MSLENVTMSWLPTRERWAYPDLFSRLGQRKLLKSFYLWYMLKILDPQDMHIVPRIMLVDYCQQVTGWCERTIKTHLVQGNNILWEKPAQGRAGGQICYFNASQVLENLNDTPREFNARLMPLDCVWKGYYNWLERQLESYISYVQNIPFISLRACHASRRQVRKDTGVSRHTQKRIGLLGQRSSDS